jgi:hypothetical protein
MANVYTSVANAAWYTDRVSISTGNTAVTFNVYGVAVTGTDPGTGNPITIANAVGNLYSNAVAVPANAVYETYVGAGNRLTITGANFTATEIGTASSATEGN